jgi:hypothetical protein
VVVVVEVAVQDDEEDANEVEEMEEEQQWTNMNHSIQVYPLVAMTAMQLGGEI